MTRFEDVLDDEEEDQPESREEEMLNAEKEFLSIDLILSSAQAYQMVTRGEYVSMPGGVIWRD